MRTRDDLYASRKQELEAKLRETQAHLDRLANAQKAFDAMRQAAAGYGTILDLINKEEEAALNAKLPPMPGPQNRGSEFHRGVVNIRGEPFRFNSGRALEAHLKLKYGTFNRLCAKHRDWDYQQIVDYLLARQDSQKSG